MNRLRELRKERGLSQVRLANEMSINIKTLRRYEVGENNPRVAILIELADYFDVSIDYLVGRSDVR
ncbi:helix-turn-helix domain-containing protein [Leuconostoc mesenteroides]|uniref:helix-turn-helix domain-containing protein n=1 Tax=Leuconostoc mesenteroides TaxID=1245 RepID=UPI001CC053CE|nr:helix-turn-helix transcriptional regulator [Leuconostoc mesenteroides]MBZ1508892.1 helix-turn-helix transcriptional regulator [Leuconostoc mesenteroides]MBZ1532810.1 helix-turn-helix transcriptional regulator [Leuconostoc mesenteroides]